MEKLIRQNLNLDDTAKTRKADPSELDRLLGRKLVEESNELCDVLTMDVSVFPIPDERKKRIVDESADLIEVLNTILWRHGISSSAIAMRVGSKSDERGGFIDRVLTNAVDDRTETKLRVLVEDCMRILLSVASGAWPVANGGREAIAELHQRADELGCLGTVA